MIKRKLIPFLKLFVTCTYLMGMLVSLLVHDHTDHIVSYQEADACERVIYYADTQSDCHHQAHFTNELEKCSLCDVHVFTAHDRIQSFQFSFHNQHHADSYNYIALESFNLPLFYSNKGPPLI